VSDNLKLNADDMVDDVGGFEKYIEKNVQAGDVGRWSHSGSSCTPIPTVCHCHYWRRQTPLLLLCPPIPCVNIYTSMVDIWQSIYIHAFITMLRISLYHQLEIRYGILPCTQQDVW